MTSRLRAGANVAVTHPAPGWVVGVRPLRGELGNNTPEGGRYWISHDPSDPSFVEIDGRGDARALRSCSGIVPLYVGSTSGGVAISTCIADLVRILPDPPPIDRLVYAMWASGIGCFPENRSFLRGFEVLERGSTFTVRGGSSGVTTRTWDPRPERLDPEGSLERNAIEFREIVLERIRGDLDPDGANLLSLSGGIDSSSLAHLASEVLGLPFATASFVSSAEPQGSQNRAYLEAVCERVRPTVQFVDLISPQRRVSLAESAPASIFCTPHPVLQRLPVIAESTEVRVLFGGEGADALCGSRLTFSEWSRHTRPWRLIRTPGMQLPTGPADRGRWLRSRWRARGGRVPAPHPPALREWFSKSVRDEYEEWWRAENRRWRADTGTRATLARLLADDGWLAMNWEACSRLGISRSAPFWTKETIELASRCHPRDLVGPGPKRLLREAFAGDVPGTVLERRDKGHGAGSSQSVSPDEVAPPRDLGPLEGILREPTKAWSTDPGYRLCEALLERSGAGLSRSRESHQQRARAQGEHDG